MKTYKRIVLMILLGLQLVSVLPVMEDDICWLGEDRACIAAFHNGGTGTIRPLPGIGGIDRSSSEGANEAPCSLCIFCLEPFTEPTSLALNPNRGPERLFRIETRFSYLDPALSSTTPPS